MKREFDLIDVFDEFDYQETAENSDYDLMKTMNLYSFGYEQYRKARDYYEDEEE